MAAETLTNNTWGVLAEFEDVQGIQRACCTVRDAGFTRWDAHSPFPVHGLDAAMGLPPSRLPWLVFVTGMLGAASGMSLQWWTSAVDYPLIIAAKPYFSWPAFIPVTFELGVLFAALGAVLGMLHLNRLPTFYHPLFRSERFARVTDDRFFVSIEAVDPKFDPEKTVELLKKAGATHVELLEDPPRRALGVPEKIAAMMTTWSKTLPYVALLLCGLLAVACRGNKSQDPPIHLQQNMDFQPFEAQEANPFFADGRAMRPPVPNTIARGELHEDSHMTTGRINGLHAATLPMPLTASLLQRGRERFDIYCAICHGRTGDGQSVIMQRKAMRIPPPSYLDQRLLAQPVGYFFDVISNGVRNMPPYAVQIPTKDRWAIAAYVRALQLAGTGRCDQVPAAVRASNGWTCRPSSSSER